MMNRTRFALIVVPALLSACAAQPNRPVATVECSPRQGWEQVRRAQTPTPSCRSDDYLSAVRLARELGGLEAQTAQLQRELNTLADGDREVGRIQRRIRQIAVDIEAIKGLAQVRGLVDATTRLPPNN